MGSESDPNLGSGDRFLGSESDPKFGVFFRLPSKEAYSKAHNLVLARERNLGRNPTQIWGRNPTQLWGRNPALGLRFQGVPSHYSVGTPSVTMAGLRRVGCAAEARPPILRPGLPSRGAARRGGGMVSGFDGRTRQFFHQAVRVALVAAMVCLCSSPRIGFSMRGRRCRERHRSCARTSGAPKHELRRSSNCCAATVLVAKKMTTHSASRQRFPRGPQHPRAARLRVCPGSSCARLMLRRWKAPRGSVASRRSLPRYSMPKEQLQSV